MVGFTAATFPTFTKGITFLAADLFVVFVVLRFVALLVTLRFVVFRVARLVVARFVVRLVVARFVTRFVVHVRRVGLLDDVLRLVARFTAIYYNESDLLNVN